MKTNNLFIFMVVMFVTRSFLAAQEELGKAADLIQKGDLASVGPLLSSLIKQEHPAAIALNGVASLGLSTNSSEQKAAMNEIQKAADKGFTKACQIIANLCLEKGSPYFDKKRGENALKQAAWLGDKEAQMQRAGMINDKARSPEEYLEAMYWIRCGFASENLDCVILMSNAVTSKKYDLFQKCESLMLGERAGPIYADGKIVVPSKSWKMRWVIELLLHALLEDQRADRKWDPPLPPAKADDLLGASDVLEYYNKDLRFGKFYMLAVKGKGAAKADVLLTKEDIWKEITPGDFVLISDRVTHHYVAVYRIDRKAGKIYFIEPQPEKFVLNDGQNVLGIKAEDSVVKYSKIVKSVTKDEFFKVILADYTYRHLDSEDPSQISEKDDGIMKTK